MSASSVRPLAFKARHRIQSTGGVRIALERYGAQNGPPVLLVHGASAASDTFFLASSRSLVDHLVDAKFTVWALDWRASFHVLEDSFVGPQLPPDEAFLLESAEHDLHTAMEHIQRVQPGRKVAILAHCLGAGLTAQAIARDDLARAWPIASLTLVALGLFYRVSAGGMIKAQDRLLQQLKTSDRPKPWLSPNEAEDWTGRGPVARAFRWYMNSPLARGLSMEQFARLSFMYGRPYRPELLPPSIHHKETLRAQFGPMHLSPYIQGTANILRGWAGDHGARLEDRSLLRAEPFQRFPVTLLTGARNRLWHRDSVDRMEAFLRRSAGRTPASLKKIILPDYAHQDLYWGRHAARDVFPHLTQAVAA